MMIPCALANGSKDQVMVKGWQHRLADIPNRAGQWGLLLSSLAAFGWLMALTFDPLFPRWSSALILVTTFLPRWAIFLWLAGASILPIFGIAIGSLCARTLGSWMGLTTWSYMLFSTFVGPILFFPPGIGVYFALSLACLNADVRFWRARLAALR